MEDTVKLDAGPEAGIDNNLYHLPDFLQEADPPGVCVSLGYQYQDGPPQLRWHIPDDPHILEYVHDLYSPSRFGGFSRSLYWIGLADPWLEVFCAEVGMAACLVWEEASDRFLHSRL